MADTWVRPYAVGGGVQEAPGIGVKRSLPRRGGAEPAPYRVRRGVVTPPYGRWESGTPGSSCPTGAMQVGRGKEAAGCEFCRKGGAGAGWVFAKFSAFPLAFSIAIAYNGFH